MAESAPRPTQLHDLHVRLGGRMVDFAGWAMPVQYPAGILKEHLHCRAAAALFDVSHMGQLSIEGPDPFAAFERLVPAAVRTLAPGRQRYTVLTNERGGIRDDLIFAHPGDGRLALVVNAGNRDGDLAHLRAALEPEHRVVEHADRALLALQGPAARGVLVRLAPGSAGLTFMMLADLPIAGIPCRVSCSGYTGEDGFEISVAGERAVELAERLLAEPEVEPAGLGARDSLRLEAGLPLHGHDIDPDTTPVEAGLAWSIPKSRRAAAGFPGHDVIARQLAEGPGRRLVGLRPEGRVVAREGTPIADGAGRAIGRITSGGFGPSVNGPIAMAYVAADHAEPGTALQLTIRGKAHPAVVQPLPFVPHRYVR